MTHSYMRYITLAIAFVVCAKCRSETLAPAIQFDRGQALYGGYYATDTTGSITITVPPEIADSGPLTITDAPIAEGDAVTTTVQYDTLSTLTWSLPVSGCVFGPHYLTVRLPDSGLRGWTWFIRKSPVSLSSEEDVTSKSLKERYSQIDLRRQTALFDSDTTGCWLGIDPATDYHLIREDVYYATTLLDRQDSASLTRANEVLQTVCRLQDRTSGNPADYGVFYEGPDRLDHSTMVNFFATPLLARMVLDPPPGLTSDTLTEIRTAIRYSCEFLNHRFQIGYSLDHTNFQALGIAGLALTGRALGEQRFTDRAKSEMDLWYDHIITNGGTFEYNSPVYTGVTQWALKLLIENGADESLVARSSILYERFWLDAALYHDPVRRQFAGPYSRAYPDVVYGGTNLAGFLLSWELASGGYATAGRLSENFDSSHSHDIDPAYFETTLEPAMSSELRGVFRHRALPAESWQKTIRGETRCWLDKSFTLGTEEKAPAVGGEPFLLQVAEPAAPGGIAAMIARCGAITSETLDFNYQGIPGIKTVQDQGNALVLCHARFATERKIARKAGLFLIADERFARWEDMRLNGVACQPPIAMDIGDTLFIRRDGAFLAIQPLYATSIGSRGTPVSVERDHGHLAISLNNLDTTASVNLANTVLQGGFAVACTEASDWADYDAFISAFTASSTTTVQETQTSRSITWDWERGELDAVLDRSSGDFIAQQASHMPPAGQLVSSEFAVQTDGTSITLKDLSITGAAPGSWVVYPDGSQTALFVNPTAAAVTLHSTWNPDMVTVPAYQKVELTRPVDLGISEWMRYQ